MQPERTEGSAQLLNATKKSAAQLLNATREKLFLCTSTEKTQSETVEQIDTVKEEQDLFDSKDDYEYLLVSRSVNESNQLRITGCFELSKERKTTAAVLKMKTFFRRATITIKRGLREFVDNVKKSSNDYIEHGNAPESSYVAKTRSALTKEQKDAICPIHAQKKNDMCPARAIFRRLEISDDNPIGKADMSQMPDFRGIHTCKNAPESTESDESNIEVDNENTNENVIIPVQYMDRRYTGERFNRNYQFSLRMNLDGPSYSWKLMRKLRDVDVRG
eukprot:scaffold63030_cov20-Cyclotella_meneghiniana.AAC.1